MMGLDCGGRWCWWLRRTSCRRAEGVSVGGSEENNLRGKCARLSVREQALTPSGADKRLPHTLLPPSRSMVAKYSRRIQLDRVRRKPP